MPDTSAPAYDVFISYSAEDKAWVALAQWLRALAERLRAAA
jgi:hypothetical protein